MKAVILAGGKGTRLAPFTTAFPKPLMPIGNIPILEIILWQLQFFGFSQIHLACGHLAELINAYLLNRSISERLQIRYHREKQPLGTSGALADIDGLDDTFLVMNGDILTALDYSRLLQYHSEMKASLTIAITRKKVPIELGVLEMDSQHKVIGYKEKPVQEFPASTGIYVYEPRVLDFIEKNIYLDFPTLVLRLINAGEKVVGYPIDSFWLDIGNKDDYERAHREFEKQKAAFHITAMES